MLHLAPAHSLSSNSIGGYYNDYYELVSETSGISAIAAALPSSSLTTLKCGSGPDVALTLVFSAPCRFALFLHPLSYTFHRPVACGSIGDNKLGVEGGKAFAEALPKSSLTSLKCATAHVLAFCVQRPLTFCTFPALLPLAV